jgi:hypothetical protein
MMDTINATKPQLSTLAAFRQVIYTCFLKAGEVLFETIDALLLSPRLASFPELSCVPVFRRQWPSLYEGIEDGKIDETKLLDTLTGQLPESERSLLVGDHTTWARPQARTLKDRSFQHQPTPIKGQKPVAIGRLQHVGSRAADDENGPTGGRPKEGRQLVPAQARTSASRAIRRLPKRRPSN